MVTLAEHAAHTRDMEPHIATLTRLADGLWRVAEFGVRTGVSTWALLDGMHPLGELRSWDTGVGEDMVAEHCGKPDRDRIPERVTGDKRWRLHREDSTAGAWRVASADLVLIDSSHEYHHTIRELAVDVELVVPLAEPDQLAGSLPAVGAVRIVPAGQFPWTSILRIISAVEALSCGA
jgi:hypothetical protein